MFVVVDSFITFGCRLWFSLLPKFWQFIRWYGPCGCAKSCWWRAGGNVCYLINEALCALRLFIIVSSNV